MLKPVGSRLARAPERFGLTPRTVQTAPGDYSMDIPGTKSDLWEALSDLLSGFGNFLQAQHTPGHVSVAACNDPIRLMNGQPNGTMQRTMQLARHNT